MHNRDTQKAIHSMNNNINGANLKWNWSYHDRTKIPYRSYALSPWDIKTGQNNVWTRPKQLVSQGTVGKDNKKVIIVTNWTDE